MTLRSAGAKGLRLASPGEAIRLPMRRTVPWMPPGRTLVLESRGRSAKFPEKSRASDRDFLAFFQIFDVGLIDFGDADHFAQVAELHDGYLGDELALADENFQDGVRAFGLRAVWLAVGDALDVGHVV